MNGVSIQLISPARLVAFNVLEAVAEGAYASDALLEKCRNLSARDAGLASQIVFGALRYQAQLDFLVHRYSGRKAASLDIQVLISLRGAIFQLRYLDRIPPHAAVHDSVEYVKRNKRSASGLVNAVLRKVNRDPVTWPDSSTEWSCPSFLLGRWGKHFGADQAARISRAALEEPQAYTRLAQLANPPDPLQFEPTGVEGCFRLLAAPSGKTRLQDISSQAILPLLDLQAGQTLLDLCAAPGNKTLQALETSLKLAVACDISPRRIQDIPPVCPRVVLDATKPLPFSRSFDRVFVDAPCSGTGTLARNPEIKWRVTIEDFRRFHEKQVQIVINAANKLAGNGKLLYATCSLEQEENEDVIAAVLNADPNLRCTKEMWRLPGRDEGDGFYASLLQRGPLVA